MWFPTIFVELNFLSFCCACYRRVYFGPAAFDSTESFELFLHTVSELLRRFLDVPDLWVVVLRLAGGAPVPIHELWHVVRSGRSISQVLAIVWYWWGLVVPIVLPCYSCFVMHGSLTFMICQSDESAKHLWSTGCVIQSRFCRSQGSMCWVQCVLQDAGIVLHLVVAALTAWTNVRTFLNLQVWCASGSRSTFHFRIALQVSHWRTRGVCKQHFVKVMVLWSSSRASDPSQFVAYMGNKMVPFVMPCVSLFWSFIVV